MLTKVLAAGVVSASFCVLFQGRGANILVVAMNGVFGYFVYLAVPGYGEPIRLLLVSVFMAFLAELAARLRKAPAILFLSPALIPMVPGGGMFECALKMLRQERYAAAVQFGNVIMEAGSIAVGIILVSSLMAVVKRKNRGQIGDS